MKLKKAQLQEETRLAFELSVLKSELKKAELREKQLTIDSLKLEIEPLSKQ